MVIRRVPTRYQRVHVETDVDEDADNIELLQDHSNHSYEGLRNFDDEIENNRHESTLKLPSPSDRTAQIPHDDKLHFPRSSTFPRRPSEQRFLAGWRVGALVSLIGAASVCLFNLVVTIWVWRDPKNKVNGSVGTLFSGDCAKARRTNVWIHLFINVLSTLLLNASNYCMQVLSAPNREELVRAHAQRYWLHIGVPSLRNLLHIGTDRAVLWFLLFLSSVPLHLFFNSVVFTNLQANNYAVVPTTEEWIQGGSYNTSRFMNMNETEMTSVAKVMDSYRIGTMNPAISREEYQNISARECFDVYNGQYLSDTGNVYLIQNNPTVWRNTLNWSPTFSTTNGSFEWVYSKRASYTWSSVDAKFPFMSSPGFYPSNGWRCPSHRATICDVDNEFEVPKDRSKWEPYESLIKYCLVEKVDESCMLQFSFPIAIAVVASNLIKTLCMALLLVKYQRHTALVTIGDAVASFLDCPDPETRGRCLHSKRLIEKEWNWEWTNGARKDDLPIEPEVFQLKSQRWARAPSGGRWFSTYVLYAAAIIFGIVCTVRSLDGMPKDPSKLWKIGFGTVNGQNLLNFSASVISGTLVANIPQVVLSYLYLAFNALYTNMFVAKEWSTYTTERKALRVTSPVGQQRGTYWLNVPFRYAIPMTIVSGLFHWLASQSIFMIQITITSEWTRKAVDQISTCGFSPVAIILTTILGTVIAVGGVVMGRLKYPAEIPLASSCSAAISAACHPAPEDINASLLPVKWGVVVQSSRGDDGTETVGHCAFSSLPVESPIPGRLYA